MAKKPGRESRRDRRRLARVERVQRIDGRLAAADLVAADSAVDEGRCLPQPPVDLLGCREERRQGGGCTE